MAIKLNWHSFGEKGQVVINGIPDQDSTKPIVLDVHTKEIRAGKGRTGETRSYDRLKYDIGPILRGIYRAQRCNGGEIINVTRLREFSKSFPELLLSAAPMKNTYQVTEKTLCKTVKLAYILNGSVTGLEHY
jgi:hypothetical protein